MEKLFTIIFTLFFGTAYCQPDIILIYLDDSPNKITGSTGAPSFVQTPNIDSIAAHAMTFPNNYCVISLCAPSRAVMMTGFYPNITGVTDNTTQGNFNLSLPTLPGRLKQAGYYTAALGKYHDVIGVHGSDDWSYRLESTSNQGDPNCKFARNGAKPKKYLGNDTIISKVIMDSAIAIIDRTTQPLFLLISLRSPHTPTEVPAPFNHYYDNDVCVFGSEIDFYTDLYPSFMYNLPPKNYKTTAKMIPLLKDQYRSVAYVDSRIGQMLSVIDSGSMIIYTSDNGFLNDEHGLYGKRWPYRESVNIPLHIWYDGWFPVPGTSDALTSNIDLAATILHAAGADNSGTQGISIKNQFYGTTVREFAFNQMCYTTEDNSGAMAGSAAIWNHDYKLISYSCSEQTEQFFDLRNDPHEMINLIFSEPLQDTISIFRQVLSEQTTIYGRTDEVINCHLITNQ